MKNVEIICESCEAHMRLSATLLERVEGKTGRVSCAQCGNKVLLDARSSELVVKGGGYIAAEPFELEEVADFSELPPEAEYHVSETPEAMDSSRAAGEISLPPPLPAEARLRRSMRTAESPGLRELVEQVEGSEDREEFIAPEPGLFGADEGSLSPHAIDDEEEGLVPLGREFRSSPFATRDETYNSLYPQPERLHVKDAPEAPAFVSQVPAPPKAGELQRADAEAPLSSKPVVALGADGTLINQADRNEVRRQERAGSSNWAPWALAATALLALGVSVSTQADGGISGALSRTKALLSSTPIVDGATNQSPADALASPSAPVEEPVEPQEERVEERVVDAPEIEVVASLSTPAVPAPQKPAPQKPARGNESSQPSSTDPRAQEGDSGADSANTNSADIEAPKEAEPSRAPFDAAAAQVAMRESTALAGACRRPGDPTGYAKVVVTFAPSGRVTSASVSGPPFAGTQTGGCIASRFRSSRVPAFSGEHVTVSKTVSIR